MKRQLLDCLRYLKSHSIEKVFVLWLVVFIIPPVPIMGVVRHYSFANLSQRGLFPDGATSTEEMVSISFMDRVNREWFDGAITPTGARVCVTNNNRVYINGVDIALPSESDPETGAMDIYVNFSDYTSHKLLYVPIYEERCESFSIKPGTTFASSTLIFRSPSKIPFALSKDEEGKLHVVATTEVNPGMSTYTMSPLWSDVAILTLKIYGVWWVFLLALAESWKITSCLRRFVSGNNL